MAEFKLPEVGEGITKGTIVNVLVKVGDTVAKDQPVIELETDKAVVEVPSSVAGVVQEIRVQANKEANIGDVILVVGEGAAAPTQAEAPKPDAPKEAGKTEASKENELKSDAVTAAKQEPEPVSAKEVETPKPSAQNTPASPSASQHNTGKETPPSTTYTSSTAKPAVGPTGERRLLPAAPSVRRMAREMGVSLQ
ncbi:MAG: biotin/lipoyl-containing protein, partial [Trueperaceae bacterium]